jgi:hypothetical protein
MRTNRNVWIIAILAAGLLFSLAGCRDPASDLTGIEGETIPPGMGLARIRLSAGGPADVPAQSARTAVPNIAAYYFTLDFSAPDKTTVHKTLSGGSSVTVALDPATWTLEVKGYTNSYQTDLKLSGTATVPITGGTLASFDISLTPNLTSGVTGSLAYSVILPGTVSRAWLGLYPVDSIMESTSVTMHEIDLSASAGSTAAGTISNLSEGSYRAVIDLYDETGNKAAIRSEAVHIYGGLSTPLARNFASGDFSACPPVVGEESATLAAKLDAALASPEGAYTIVLNGAESDLAAFTPKALSVTGKKISVTIRGKGRTVQVDRSGTPLFTLGAASGAGLSLELRDITLRGLSGNSVPVVRVGSGGTLSMKAGSRVTGNTFLSGGSGGVYVDGTFNMSGGEVSGNTGGGGGGGGVYVSNGTFSMSGGAVSGNTASSYGGGGVYVSNGTFSMSGGAVSGNTASSSYGGGGGVYVSNGIFSMSGGAVSGNTATNAGGGVAVTSGAFSMSGGVVSGNTVSDDGGGVAVTSGTFSMSGGTVRDNILSGTNSYGREVVVAINGIFKMSGEARPERVFLDSRIGITTRFITIAGPLSGEVAIPIDLVVTDIMSLTDYVNAPILKLDTSYSTGDMAALKTHFTLGNSKMMESPYTEAPITGYVISDTGFFVEE